MAVYGETYKFKLYMGQAAKPGNKTQLACVDLWTGLEYDGRLKSTPRIFYASALPSFCPHFGPSVRPTNPDFFAHPAIHLSICLKGFRTFSRRRMEGMTWHLACWCILASFRTDKCSLWSVNFLIFALFWHSETDQIRDFRPFLHFRKLLIIQMRIHNVSN